mmetsp:Transcript_3192/g.4600  ORF Transcript_3192/g.4600 Transcript_3192/m.4600 type:complete len:221 (-) Transcript_3192:186-848(-)
MKITHGSWSLANPNISRISRALSPMYLSTIALATTLRKVAFKLHASARAKSVFPVPGGPYKSTPFGGLIPTLKNSSGFVRGNSMVSRSCRISSPRPPTSEYEILPGSSLSILYTVGSTSRGRIRIIVNVVMSKDTRTPDKSFVLSTFFLTPTTYRGPLDAFTMYRSSSSCFNTSPIICPTLCKALRSSSVFWKSLFRSFIFVRIPLTLASISRCLMSVFR